MSLESSTRQKRCFETSDFNFCLLRLTDEEYQIFRDRSFPITFNDMLSWHLSRKRAIEPSLLNLPKLLVLLEKDFGHSSTFCDFWKQSFCFPFLVKVQKVTDLFYYLLQLSDFRGNIRFDFYRIIDSLKYLNKDLEIYHKPISDELSEGELQYITGYVWGFYEGYGETYFKNESHIPPFFRYIPSNNLVYGYWDNHFIERFFEDPEICREFVDRLETKYR